MSRCSCSQPVTLMFPRSSRSVIGPAVELPRLLHVHPNGFWSVGDRPIAHGEDPEASEGIGNCERWRSQLRSETARTCQSGEFVGKRVEGVRECDQVGVLIRGNG